MKPRTYLCFCLLIAITGCSTNKHPSKQNDVVSPAVPIVTLSPAYPQAALEERISGWAKARFTITKNGTVINPEIIAAEPPEIFNQATLDAVAKFKFKPKIVNGKAVEQVAIQMINFELPELKNWVKVRFTVNKEGKVINPEVLDSHPKGTFDEAAIKAVSQRKFEPKVVNGQKVEQVMTRTLGFIPKDEQPQ